MTVQSATRQVTYTGNGAAINFIFSFIVKKNEHLTVTLYDSTLKTYTTISSTNYKVTGGSGSTGYVTYRPGGVPLSSRYKLILARNVPYTQDLDIYNQDGFYPETVEDQLDLIVMQIQQLKDRLSQLVNVPIDEASITIPPRDLRKDKYFGFDLLGEPVALGAPVAFTDTSLLRFSARNAVQAATIAAGTKTIFLNGYTTDGDGGGGRYKSVASEPAHTAKVQSANGLWFETDEPLLTSTHTGGVANLCKAGYLTRSIILVKSGETADLTYDSALGDNFPAMAAWLAASAIADETGVARLKIANGLHDIAGHFNLTRGRQLEIVGTGAATAYQITGLTFVLDDAVNGIYSVGITVSTAVSAEVVAGYSIGCQNCKGDGGAEAVNGAHIVESVSGDRLTVTVKLHVDVDAVQPTNTTVFDNSTTLGMAANKLLVLPNCIRADSAGWNGTAEDQEGFINLLEGGAQLRMENVGFSYNGAQDEHDLLFIRGGGSNMRLMGCILAGAGDKVIRGAGGAYIDVRNCCLGGGITGRELVTVQACATAFVQRSSVGSATLTAFAAADGSKIDVNQCVATGCNAAIRTTYVGASGLFTNGRITHCDIGLQLTSGVISVDTLVSIRLCTAPVSISGPLLIKGNPTTVDNLTDTYVAGRWYNGGYWDRYGDKPGILKGGPFAVNFGSLAAGASETQTFTVTGARLGDPVLIGRANTYPTDDVSYTAWVSATNTVSFKAVNRTGGTHDPAAANYYFLVVGQ